MRTTLRVLAILALVAGAATPQDAGKDISRGKIKKIDADKGIIVVTVDGADKEAVANDKTRFMGAGGNMLTDGLRSAELKPGADVMFKLQTRDGKAYLVGLRVVGKAQAAAGPTFDTSRLKPLTEMGDADYHGHKGGLYPDGKNTRPAAHEAAGLVIAKAVRPLDGNGKPSADGKIVHVLHERFPNLKMVYLSSRTYAGYARSGLNPEPYAWESALSVRWLIEQQLKGDPAFNYDAAKGKVTAPWLSWGPYLWANGMTKRADGFYYEESDFGKDGTHPSATGQQKVARELLRFFKNDPTTRPWFTTRQ